MLPRLLTSTQTFTANARALRTLDAEWPTKHSYTIKSNSETFEKSKVDCGINGTLRDQRDLFHDLVRRFVGPAIRLDVLQSKPAAKKIPGGPTATTTDSTCAML